ncbi:MAG: hypothetical protein JNK27_01250 [Chitinophagaceae bacterium]|nr:hypothetical protein [Chitinophagaceae bacterium]
MDKLKSALEKAWEDGFFYNLRYGFINRYEFEELKSYFDNVSEEEIDFRDKRLLSLLWFIPLFISWQEERLRNNKTSEEAIKEVSNYFYNQCERILGLP